MLCASVLVTMSPTSWPHLRFPARHHAAVSSGCREVKVKPRTQDRRSQAHIWVDGHGNNAYNAAVKLVTIARYSPCDESPKIRSHEVFSFISHLHQRHMILAIPYYHCSTSPKIVPQLSRIATILIYYGCVGLSHYESKQ
jgi:hypothetical protein